MPFSHLFCCFHIIPPPELLKIKSKKPYGLLIIMPWVRTRASPLGYSHYPMCYWAGVYGTYFSFDFIKIDFGRMILYSGEKAGPVKRLIEPSLYTNYFTSSSQTTLDLKILKLQVDNQIRNPEFPVAFSKFVPLKTLDETGWLFCF